MAPEIAYPPFESPTEIARYYQTHGYVVVRGLIPAELCTRARAAFDREVKPFDGHIYRQATANPERHVLTANGHMLNSILNIQDLDPRRFASFRELGVAIVTHPRMQAQVSALLSEPGTVVQTMYFEGNPATWAHQDTYYLDSTELGRMTAAWIAVEDIAPGAGRFYVYPGSHRLELPRNRDEIDVAFHHAGYKNLVKELIREHQLVARAPALSAGDVLFWSSRTIHGSEESTPGTHASRSSFTAHFIPRSTGLLQFQSREKRMRLENHDGVLMHHPKDQARLSQRAILAVETRFPHLFQLAKRVAIKVLTQSSNGLQINR